MAKEDAKLPLLREAEAPKPASTMSSPSSFARNTLPMAALLTVLTSAQGLLTTASKTGGRYAYNFATVPFLSEITKLLISWNLLQQQKVAHPEQARITKDWRTVALFPVPSLIYMVHNNVQVRAAQGAAHGERRRLRKQRQKVGRGCSYGGGGGVPPAQHAQRGRRAGGAGTLRHLPQWPPALTTTLPTSAGPTLHLLRTAAPVACCPARSSFSAPPPPLHPPFFSPLHSFNRPPARPRARLQFYFLKYVNPATYQILGNLKIVSTGLLLRLCLGRRLSLLQWMALVLLTVGATTSQVRGAAAAGAASAWELGRGVGQWEWT